MIARCCARPKRSGTWGPSEATCARRVGRAAGGPRRHRRGHRGRPLARRARARRWSRRANLVGCVGRPRPFEDRGRRRFTRCGSTATRAAVDRKTTCLWRSRGLRPERAANVVPTGTAMALRPPSVASSWACSSAAGLHWGRLRPARWHAGMAVAPNSGDGTPTHARRCLGSPTPWRCRHPTTICLSTYVTVKKMPRIPTPALALAALWTCGCQTPPAPEGLFAVTILLRQAAQPARAVREVERGE
jgi:hypothetical protein